MQHREDRIAEVRYERDAQAHRAAVMLRVMLEQGHIPKHHVEHVTEVVNASAAAESAYRVAIGLDS